MASKKYDSLAALADEKPGADDGDGMDTEEGEGLPPEFESAAIEAFPELDGEHARLQAFYDAVEACKGGGGMGGKPGLAIMIGSKKGK